MLAGILISVFFVQNVFMVLRDSMIVVWQPLQ